MARQQGFILAVVLWIVAIIFIIAGIFHHYVQEKITIGIQVKSHLQQQLNLHSTEQTVFYVLSTSRLTRAGMTLTRQNIFEYIDVEEGTINTDPRGDEMFLDGTNYLGVGDSAFYVQDLMGLVALNAPDNYDLQRLMAKQEPNAQVNQRLLTALQDYVDANDTLSLSGAEKYEYARAGLAAPSNDYLRSEIELQRVYGWAQWLDLHPQFNWQGWLSVRRYSMINPNSMPKSLMQAYFGISEEIATQLVNERHKNPFVNLDDFFSRSGISEGLTEENTRFFYGNEFQVCLWSRGGGQAELISLQLTPSGPYGPWQINYKYQAPIIRRDHEPSALQQTRLFGYTLGDYL
ncbi:type II secretion system protein GspK [Cellvibrio sp. UBA7661]|uniref:type II secretion system protein GspK n=1 Tax=Cellvibrio sp. UBA7661 TaxID=1946311 RepID=UPI002F360308